MSKGKFVMSCLLALVCVGGAVPAAAQSANMSKFKNNGNCALHFIVRRGNNGPTFRFILDAGQVVHIMLPYWSTYASACDAWPENGPFSAVTFEGQ